MQTQPTPNDAPAPTRRATRADVHRPGAINPEEYTHVLYYSLATTQDCWPVPSIGINCELDHRREEKNADGINGTHAADGRCCVIGLLHFAKVAWAPTGNTGKCSVCGAHFIEGGVWRHEPTGEHIHLGHTCMDKYEFIAEQGLVSEWRARNRDIRHGAALAAIRDKNERERVAFLAEHPGLADALTVEHRIIADIAARFREYRSLSEKQIALVFKLATEVRMPKTAAAEERHCPAPEGRVTFQGVIVSAKEYDGNYGTTMKITVKVTTPTGETWLAWGTCPAAIYEGGANHDSPLRGRVVEIKATLKRGRDAHFGLMSRPCGRVVALNCAEGCRECEQGREAAAGEAVAVVEPAKEEVR